MKMVKITSKIKFITTILSLITITMAGVTVYLNNKTTQDANIVNVSGKQRMLTQKIAKEILLYDHVSQHLQDELEKSIKEFDDSLNDLYLGNIQRGLYAPPTQGIKSSLEVIINIWNDFHQDIVVFLEKRKLSKEYHNKLIDQDKLLLQLSEDIIQQAITLDVNLNTLDKIAKQRMLTQKMLLHINGFAVDRNKSDFKSFYETLDSFEKTILFFKDYSNIQNSSELLVTLDKISSELELFKEDANGFVDNEVSLERLLDKIAIKNIILLNSVDELVSAYSLYSKEQRKFLQNFQYIAILISILFISYAFALILNIQSLFESFVSRSKEISNLTTPNKPVMFAEGEETDELSVASKHIDSFTKDINQIITQANLALEESQKAIEKLANISIDEYESENVENEKLKKTLNTSEDIAIQSLEELAVTAKKLQKLQENFNNLQ